MSITYGAEHADLDQWAEPDGTVHNGHEISDDIPPPPEPPPDGEPPARPIGRRVQLTAASEITARQVQWAWDERIPAGVIALWAGREGIGKSLAAVWLIAQITNGTLPGIYFGTPRCVIVSASEDSWSHVLVPRLMAAGAVLSMVYRIEVEVDDSGDGLPITLPLDLGDFEAAVRQVDAAAVILDPLFSVISSNLDTKDERKLRTALDPMKAIADRTRCTIIGIVHFNKGTSTDVSDRIQGARGFSNVTRSTTSFGRIEDDDTDNVGILSTTKNSYGKDYRSGLESLTYVIEQETVRTVDGPTDVGRLRFTGTTDVSVADTLREQGGREDEDNASDVERWLVSFIADEGGSAKAADVFRAADAAGHSKDQAKRAKKKLGIVASHPHIGGPWFWEMPSGKDSEGSTKGAPASSAAPLLPCAPLQVSDSASERPREQGSKGAVSQGGAPLVLPSVTPPCDSCKRPMQTTVDGAGRRLCRDCAADAPPVGARPPCEMCGKPVFAPIGGTIHDACAARGAAS